MMSLATMLTCRWAAHRIQWYVDADPSSPLTPAQTRRLGKHLATCQSCAAIASDHRALRGALARWAQRPIPEPHAVIRLEHAAGRLRDQGPG